MPTAKVNGVVQYYELHGRGEPVVLIQGLGANHRFWGPLVQLFARRRQVLIYDWRGTGLSEPFDHSITTRELAHDLAALLTHLGLGPVDVVARDMGGCIGQYLAIDHPEMVRSLVLASTWARADGFLSALFASWGRLVEQIGYAAVLEQAVLWAFPREYFDTPGGHRQQEIAHWLAGAATLGQPPASFRHLSRAGLAHDALDDLGRLQARVLVTAGREDIFTPLALAMTLYRVIPRARLVIFEGAGHAFFEQIYEKFADEVEQFWSRVEMRDVTKV